MDSIRKTSQRALAIYALFLFSSCTTGVQSDIKRTECPNEQIALNCPGLESAIQTGAFLELQWRVTDNKYPGHLKKQYIGYCNKSLNCTRYRDIGSFDQRITVSNPVRGTLLVKQMELNDRLIYTCVIQRSGNKDPIANTITVTSSKRCLSSTTGQNLDLSQTFHLDMFSEGVEEIEWYGESEDGTRVKIAYCSPSSTCRLVENCISSCPEYLTRLKTDGLSIILSKVTEADRGLEFQCQIHRKFMTKVPRVYMIRIKEILPRAAGDGINQTTVTTRTTTRATATSAANTIAPSRNNTGSYSIQNSCLIAFSVVISLVIAPYGIS